MTRKIVLLILISASVLWTAFIFSNSLADAERSTEQSSGVTEVINKTAEAVGIEQEIKESTVRNMAHFTEFAVLSVLLSAISAVITHRKVKTALTAAYALLAVPSCFAVACADEFIQKFSDGRATQFTDVLLDTAGALCACALFIAVYCAVIHIADKIKKRI